MIIKTVEDQVKNLESLLKTSNLPNKPNYNEIKQLLIKLIKESHRSS